MAKYDDFVCRCSGLQGRQERGGGRRFEAGNRVVSVLRGEPSGTGDFSLDIQQFGRACRGIALALFSRIGPWHAIRRGQPERVPTVSRVQTQLHTSHGNGLRHGGMLGEQPGWQATNTLPLSGKYFSACAFSLLYVRDFRLAIHNFLRKCSLSFLTHVRMHTNGRDRCY